MKTEKKLKSKSISTQVSSKKMCKNLYSSHMLNLMISIHTPLHISNISFFYYFYLLLQKMIKYFKEKKKGGGDHWTQLAPTRVQAQTQSRKETHNSLLTQTHSTNLPCQPQCPKQLRVRRDSSSRWMAHQRLWKSGYQIINKISQPT